MSSPGSAETLWVRERVTGLLQNEGWHSIAESVGRVDGWRGEFLLTSEKDGDVVLTAHKPEDVSYVSLGVFVSVETPSRVSDWSALVDCVSDFEVSMWFRDETPSCVLSSRIYLAALDVESFDFQLGNLLAARTSVAELDSDEVDVDVIDDGRETSA